jgi:hypothetical protein
MSASAILRGHRAGASCGMWVGHQKFAARSAYLCAKVRLYYSGHLEDLLARSTSALHGCCMLLLTLGVVPRKRSQGSAFRSDTKVGLPVPIQCCVAHGGRGATCLAERRCSLPCLGAVNGGATIQNLTTSFLCLHPPVSTGCDRVLLLVPLICCDLDLLLLLFV